MNQMILIGTVVKVEERQEDFILDIQIGKEPKPFPVIMSKNILKSSFMIENSEVGVKARLSYSEYGYSVIVEKITLLQMKGGQENA